MSLTSPPIATIDVTGAATAATDVVAAFDALAPGEAVLVRTVGRPEAALRALHATRWGAYDWAPLVEGPGHWEVEIHKRRGISALRSVKEALEWDHDRLDGLDLSATEAWDKGRMRDGAQIHQRFIFGLLRHIRFEESVLFPEFERVSGIAPDRGPTGVMRVEHRMIEMLLADMAEAVSRGVRPAVRTRDDLREGLSAHNHKEEKVLYPMLDCALTPAESDALVFLFQSMEPAA